MRITMQIPADHQKIINSLREKLYPGSSPKEYQASFIINQVVDSFDASRIQELDNIIMNDSKLDKAPRTIAFRQHTYNKLDNIANSLNVSPALALRAIILYSHNTDIIHASISNDHEQLLKLKVTQLEKKLEEACCILEEIQKLL